MASCKTENKTSDIVVVLDNSGSMDVMGDEPIQALNEFINDQKKIGDNSLFSLWKFSNKALKVVDKKIIKEVSELESMRPDGMTALYDALQCSISDNIEKEDVVFVVVTDGLDNASQYSSKKIIKKMIEDCEKNKNWKFFYLGANQDSFQVGYDGLGISSCTNYDQKDEEQGFSKILRQTSASVYNTRQTSISNTSQQPVEPPVLNRSNAVPLSQDNHAPSKQN